MKQTSSILGAVLSFLLLLAAVLGYAYGLSSIDAFRAAAAEAKNEGAAAEAREHLARSSSSFLSGIANEREELAASIASDAEFVSVIDTIEASGKREGVDVTIGSVAVTPSKLSFHDTVSLSLSARGSFKNVTSFTASLETLPFASRIESVAFEATDSDWFVRIKLEIPKRKP